RLLRECRRPHVFMRDLLPMSPAYEGRTVRIAVRDTAENARIVATCRSALEALRTPAAVVSGAPGAASR
ncbi:histidinol-phosphate aminotransferase family protein, partial [Streptomyces sp. Wh19]|nr:histidinol-phosphate aminotransferase family protein [Streptomyces sp. Wh19]